MELDSIGSGATEVLSEPDLGSIAHLNHEGDTRY